MIIKCKYCKKEFEQGDTPRRLCEIGYCPEQQKDMYQKKYKKERQIARLT
jgi:hypothetical protein